MEAECFDLSNVGGTVDEMPFSESCGCEDDTEDAPCSCDQGKKASFCSCCTNEPPAAGGPIVGDPSLPSPLRVIQPYGSPMITAGTGEAEILSGDGPVGEYPEWSREPWGWEATLPFEPTCPHDGEFGVYKDEHGNTYWGCPLDLENVVGNPAHFEAASGINSFGCPHLLGPKAWYRNPVTGQPYFGCKFFKEQRPMIPPGSMAASGGSPGGVQFGGADMSRPPGFTPPAAQLAIMGGAGGIGPLLNSPGGAPLGVAAAPRAPAFVAPPGQTAAVGAGQGDPGLGTGVGYSPPPNATPPSTHEADRPCACPEGKTRTCFCCGGKNATPVSGDDAGGECDVLGTPDGALSWQSGTIDLSTAAGAVIELPVCEGEEENESCSCAARERTPCCSCCAEEPPASVPVPPAAETGGGPAGEIPADFRLLPESGEPYFEQCPPGTQWVPYVARGPSGWVGGCSPPRCPLPSGYVFPPEPKCIEYPPGWTPGWRYPGQPSTPAGGGLGVVSPSDDTASSDPTWLPLLQDDADCSSKSYNLSPPPTREHPGAPDYLYIVASSPSSLYVITPTRPPAPCGYKYTGDNYIYASGGTFYFQYISLAAAAGRGHRTWKLPLASPPNSGWPDPPTYAYQKVMNLRPSEILPPPAPPPASGYVLTTNVYSDITIHPGYPNSYTVASWTFQYRLLMWKEYGLTLPSSPPGNAPGIVGQNPAQAGMDAPGQEVPTPTPDPGANATAPGSGRRFPPGPPGSPPPLSNGCGVVISGETPAPPLASDRWRASAIVGDHWSFLMQCQGEFDSYSGGIRHEVDKHKWPAVLRSEDEYGWGLHNFNWRSPTQVDREVDEFLRGMADGLQIKGDHNFEDTLSHYFGAKGGMRTISVSDLMNDIPEFAREVDRLQGAAEHWAAEFYRQQPGGAKPSYFILAGPYGSFVVPEQRSRDWFGTLDYFTYWYVACVSVRRNMTYEQGFRISLNVSMKVLIADHFWFHGLPYRAREDVYGVARGSLDPGFRPIVDDDDDAGGLVDVSGKLWAADLLGVADFPQSLMWRFGNSGPTFRPRYISTNRFLGLHSCGLAQEFDTVGSSPVRTSEFLAW